MPIISSKKVNNSDSIYAASDIELTPISVEWCHSLIFSYFDKNVNIIIITKSYPYLYECIGPYYGRFEDIFTSIVDKARNCNHTCISSTWRPHISYPLYLPIGKHAISIVLCNGGSSGILKLWDDVNNECQFHLDRTKIDSIYGMFQKVHFH